MRHVAIRHSLTACLGITATTAALALEPAKVQWGPVYFQPLLETELAYTDNLYRRTEDTRDSWILKTAPEIAAWLQNGPSRYLASYRIEDFRYSNSEEKTDDFTDHLFDLDLHHIFDARNALRIDGKYHRTHEERGTGLTQGINSLLIDRPVEYDLTNLGAQYRFGSWDTDARVELAAQLNQYEYQNFREITRFYDYDRDIYRATFFWNLSNRTALLFEGQFWDIDYPERLEDGTNNSSEEAQLFIGGEWEASAKTRGTVRVGYFEREFESPGRDKADGFSWDIGINWRPKSYSSWDFMTRRLSRETNGQGDFINSQEYGVSWLHDYSRGWRTHLRLNYAQDDFEPSDRSDERWEANIELQKQLRRWVDLAVGYRYEDRDSTGTQFGLPTLNYDRNTLFFRADFSL